MAKGSAGCFYPQPYLSYPDNMDTSIIKEPAPGRAAHKALTVTITSGKGGVGKTNITTNLGLALARTGKKVCVFDADTSLANINILLGLHPELTLEHFLRGDHSIDEIMLNAPGNLKIIPAASGINECANLSSTQQDKLLAALEQLEQQFDYLLVDSAAGINNSVLNFIQSSQYAVVVISPEPTSLTDAFSLIKVLQRRDCDQPIYILVNMCDGYAHSMEVFKRFAHAVNKFINTKVRYLGYIPTDPALKNAVSTQSPVMLSAPDSPAGRCLSLLAGILVKHFTSNKVPSRSISQFWRSQLLDQPDPVALQEPEKTPVIAPREPDSIPYSQSRFPSDRASLERQLLDFADQYRGKYGALPDSLIGLVKQECSDHADNRASEQPAEQQPVAADTFHPPLSDLAANTHQIEELVARVAGDKAQLTELLLSLHKQYRELYQSPPSPPNDHLTTTRPANTETLDEDQQALRQSIGFAAIVDQ